MRLYILSRRISPERRQNKQWIKQLGAISMVKYRVIINRDRCVDCGISVGRCPTHARVLARVLEQDRKQTSEERPSMGVFSEDLYDYVKKAIDACPERALIIEKIE